MACVGNDNDLREVVPGKGRRAFTGVSYGAVVVVHTTALAEPRQNSSALLQRGADQAESVCVDTIKSRRAAGHKNLCDRAHTLWLPPRRCVPGSNRRR